MMMFAHSVEVSLNCCKLHKEKKNNMQWSCPVVWLSRCTEMKSAMQRCYNSCVYFARFIYAVCTYCTSPHPHTRTFFCTSRNLSRKHCILSTSCTQKVLKIVADWDQASANSAWKAAGKRWHIVYASSVHICAQNFLQDWSCLDTKFEFSCELNAHLGIGSVTPGLGTEV